VRLRIDGKFIDTGSFWGHSAPCVEDLDGDGIREMNSNSYGPGHCYVFWGLTDHRFAAREQLVDKAGVPIRSVPVQKRNHQSFGSFFALVDWDGDGLWDVITGSENGSVTFFRNIGGKTSPAFAPAEKVASDGPLLARLQGLQPSLRFATLPSASEISAEP
jgi:hypothetical protein